MTKIGKVSTATFQNEVLDANLPVLVEFTAVWCGPCKMLEPIIEQLAESWTDKARIFKLDVDEDAQLAMDYQVMSVPTLVLFKGGQPVERAIGYQPKDRLEKKFSPFLD